MYSKIEHKTREILRDRMGNEKPLFLESFSMRHLIKGWFLSPGSPYVEPGPGSGHLGTMR